MALYHTWFCFMSCYYPPNEFVLGDVRCKYIPVRCFCRTGDFATGYNIYVFGDKRRTDLAMCARALKYGPIC